MARHEPGNMRGGNMECAELETQKEACSHSNVLVGRRRKGHLESCIPDGRPHKRSGVWFNVWMRRASRDHAKYIPCRHLSTLL